MLFEEAAAVVRRVGWLSRQPIPFQDRIIAASRLRVYPAGRSIYSLGDPAGDLFALASGELTVLTAGGALAPALVHLARPGWWVGEGAMVSDTPRRAGLIARSDCWTLVLTRAAIDRIARDDPDTWRRIAQITVSHLDHALAVIATLMAQDAPARVAGILARLTAMGPPPGSREPHVVRVTQIEIGEMARLSRNAVASILHEFEDAGLIRQRYGRIEIPDPSALTTVIERPEH